MSEAPKRIWMAPFEDKEIPNLWHEETQYIRADLVDELVEALEGLIENTAPVCEDSYGPEMEDTYNKARAALAKVRGEK